MKQATSNSSLYHYPQKEEKDQIQQDFEEDEIVKQVHEIAVEDEDGDGDEDEDEDDAQEDAGNDAEESNIGNTVADSQSGKSHSKQEEDSLTLFLPVPLVLQEALQTSWIDDTQTPTNNQSTISQNHNIAQLRQQGLYSLSCHLLEECNQDRIQLMGLHLGPRCATTIANYLLYDTNWSLSLTRIILDQNPIESFGCAELLKCVLVLPYLHSLSLNNCSLGPSGFNEISTLLVSPQCHLQHLSLASYACNSKGAIVPPDQTSMMSTSSLSSSVFIAYANHADSVSLCNLAAALSINTTLCSINLDGIALGDADHKVVDAMTAALKKNGTLTSLSFSNCKLSSMDAMKLLIPLSTHINIKRLALQGNLLDASIAPCIGKLFTLQSKLIRCNLSHNPLTSAVVDSLSVAILSSIQVSKMHSLNLSHCSLNDDACSQLALVLKHSSCLLRTLLLQHNQITSIGVTQLFPTIHRLQTLNLASNPIERGINEETNDTEEKTMNWHQSLFSLSQNTNLSQLNLSDCGLTDQSVLALCKAFVNRAPSSPMTRFNLSNNFFSLGVGMYLITTVQRCCWIVQMRVQHTQISHEDQLRLRQLSAQHVIARREIEPRRLRQCIQSLQTDQAKLKAKVLELQQERDRERRMRDNINNIQQHAASMRMKQEQKRALITDSINREEQRSQEAHDRMVAKRLSMCEAEKTYETRVQELSTSLIHEHQQLVSIEEEVADMKHKIESVVKLRPAQANTCKMKLRQLQQQTEHDNIHATHIKHELFRLKEQIDKGTMIPHLLALATYYREVNKIQTHN